MKIFNTFQQFLNEANAKPGPDPYMRGLTDKEEEEKKEKMKKQAEMDDDDPNAYKELPGDKEAREKGEVKTSKHVKRYHQLYGDDEKNEALLNEEKAEGDRGPIDDEKVEKALKKKSEETGVPIEFIRIVMRRGMAAWRTGHRPGAGIHQWGYARVNSFLTKGDGTWGDADSDVAKEVRDGGHDKDLKESMIFEEEETYNDYPAAASKNAQMAIDWKEKYGRDEVEAGTAVGWARAHQLAKGENLSADTVKRMASFNRHRKNSTIDPEFKDTPWLDKGYVSWLIWGGDEGVDWAMKKSEEIDRIDEAKKKGKPKSDKQKIKDLTKKQAELVKKTKDVQGEIKDLGKDDSKEPADKLQGLILRTQMQQFTVDAQKAAVQKQQIELKSKLKTVKKKEKAIDKIDKPE